MLKRIIRLTGGGFFLFILLFCFASGFSYEIEPLGKKPLPKKKSALNLVFCPLNYPDKEAFQKDTRSLIVRFKETKPFDEFNASFAFWQVDLTGAEAAQVFKLTQDFPPLKVRNDFLAGVSARIKGVYKLVIIDALGSVPCAELSEAGKDSLIIIGRKSYADDNDFAKGFLHELGHSLGLRDEGLNSQAARCRPGPPNCATSIEEAESWWGDLAETNSRVRYVNGCCGNKNYFRPTTASLMNDLDKAKDFGPVNERYLKNLFLKKE